MTYAGIGELLDYHEGMVSALRAQRNDHAGATTSAGPFFGLSHAEFDAALEALRTKLNDQVVLAMVASAEAAIRPDFESRLRSRTKDSVRRDLSDLRKAPGMRVRLTDILDVWRSHSGKALPFTEFNLLLKRRHWLAHGRYWTYKGGRTFDPPEAFAAVEDLFDACRKVAPDFPRP